MKTIIILLTLTISLSSFALDCIAQKDDMNPVYLPATGLQIDGYQYNYQIIASEYLLLIIYKKDLPKISTNTIAPLFLKGQTASISLANDDGIFSIKCE